MVNKWHMIGWEEVGNIIKGVGLSPGIIIGHRGLLINLAIIKIGLIISRIKVITDMIHPQVPTSTMNKGIITVAMELAMAICTSNNS